MIGMYPPIMRRTVLLTGDKLTQANVPPFVANALDQEWGRWLFYIALFVGFLILFVTPARHLRGPHPVRRVTSSRATLVQMARRPYSTRSRRARSGRSPVWVGR
jgi:hypothetical protein